MKGTESAVDRTTLTAIIQESQEGRVEALSQLVPLIYDELRKVARRQLRRRQPRMSIDTTELVHETFIKLAKNHVEVNDRGHYFSLVAQAMRQILVDLARRAKSAKRGAGLPDQTLEESVLIESGSPNQWLEVDEALEKLHEVHPQLARVVECRFYGGLTEEETALALDQSVRTVQRHWKRARLWLRKFLSDGNRSV